MYNGLWFPALPLAMLLTGDFARERRLQRMGRFDCSIVQRGATQRLWIHAASVGEVEAIRGVARQLIRETPNCFAIATTMTRAGCEAARHRLPEARAWVLAPFDLALAARGFIKSLKPTLALIAETELWPNQLIEAHRFGARIAIVNGRISERSARRYQWARPLFADALGGVDLILAQTPGDAERFARLGAHRDRIVVTGNTKLDLDADPAPLRPAFDAFGTGRRLLIAGSTAPGEEQIVLDAFRELRGRFTDLALVIAPRHLERAEEVARLVRMAAMPYARASALQDKKQPADVLILDTMGELRALYRRAAIAFIGGSLAPGRGGQSLAEPAAASVPVLFGPYHHNQREIADALIAGGGGRVVADASELARECADLLSNETIRCDMGRRARAVIENLGGAVARSLPPLRALIKVN